MNFSGDKTYFEIFDLSTNITDLSASVSVISHISVEADPFGYKKIKKLW